MKPVRKKQIQIINWIIFFVLHYFCYIGFSTMNSDSPIKYSGICQGNYGISFVEFDSSKDTIFGVVVWELFTRGMLVFLQAGVVSVTLLIMGFFERAETIMKFILWDMGSKKLGDFHMQSFPWISVLYLFVSTEIFRNVIIFSYC